jgi:hypothetical protein
MTQGARKSTTYILKSKSNNMTQGSRKSTTYILKSKSNKMTQVKVLENQLHTYSKVSQIKSLRIHYFRN